eukprot:TRINITY_DN62110_c0_g1_i1.p1 TRINITY_DN62110_c0_g1~~TRINITY_DN62110_c0_g1_i1.p1  ORF type:complete len:527 (-),score=109.86 TRINITY_DN62110_c0_g1_i1:41-1450(-)
MEPWTCAWADRVCQVIADATCAAKTGGLGSAANLMTAAGSLSARGQRAPLETLPRNSRSTAELRASLQAILAPEKGKPGAGPQLQEGQAWSSWRRKSMPAPQSPHSPRQRGADDPAVRFAKVPNLAGGLASGGGRAMRPSKDALAAVAALYRVESALQTLLNARGVGDAWQRVSSGCCSSAGVTPLATPRGTAPQQQRQGSLATVGYAQSALSSTTTASEVSLAAPSPRVSGPSLRRPMVQLGEEAPGCGVAGSGGGGGNGSPSGGGGISNNTNISGNGAVSGISGAGTCGSGGDGVAVHKMPMSARVATAGRARPAMVPKLALGRNSPFRNNENTPRAGPVTAPARGMQPAVGSTTRGFGAAKAPGAGYSAPAAVPAVPTPRLSAPVEDTEQCYHNSSAPQLVGTAPELAGTVQRRLSRATSLLAKMESLIDRQHAAIHAKHVPELQRSSFLSSSDEDTSDASSQGFE